MKTLPRHSLLATLLLTAGSAWAAPTVNNPGFESGSLSGWLYSSQGVGYSAAGARSGTGCVFFSANATGHASILQTVTGLSPNTLYRLTGYGRLGSAGGGWIGVESYGGAEVYGTVTSQTDYQEIDVTFTTGASNTSAVIFMGNTGSGSVYGDDFSVTQVLLPASDPNNTQNWTLNSTFSDEFNGTALDSNKWANSMLPPAYWNGRAPSQFDSGNVSVSGGALHLAMINQNLLPNGNFEAGTLSNWAATGTTTITSLYNGTGEASDWWYAVKLGASATIQQTVTGLQPNTTYTLSGKFKIGSDTSVGVSASNFGGTTATATLNATDTGTNGAKDANGKYQWVLRSTTFKTGAASTSATILVTNGSAAGVNYCDEIAVVPSTLATGTHLSPGYYLSASVVQSKNLPVFGYYEARIKAANAPNASAFWFWYNRDASYAGQEIDVCELVGNPVHINPSFPNYDQLMPMNTHYFPNATTDFNNPAKATASGRVADDFHVYGVDWEPGTITYYLDGSKVNQITQSTTAPTANGQTQVEQLRWLTFDTEIFSYYGINTGASDFQVDYVRAWTK